MTSLKDPAIDLIHERFLILQVIRTICSFFNGSFNNSVFSISINISIYKKLMHFAYYFFLPRTLNKRMKMRSRDEYCGSFNKIYNGNIVIDHFLRKIKTFSGLDKNRFN